MTQQSIRNTLQSTFAILIGALFVPQAAEAACPASHATASCDAQSGMEICERLGSMWACKLDTGSGGQGGSGYVVWDASALEYSAYGTADNGRDFCCNLSNYAGLEEVQLVGSDAADSLLSFSDITNGLELDAYSAMAFRAYILGAEGDDEIHGSNSTNPAYTEFLHGEDGFDIIFGNAGDDHLLGGKNGDYLDGGSGNDVLNGENGHDTLLGGTGDDIVNGNDGNDALNGDEGSDKVLGGNLSDTLCGGGYTGTPDSFDGGDGSDFICGMTGGAETGTGGPRSDVCYDPATTLVLSCSLNGRLQDCVASCP